MLLSLFLQFALYGQSSGGVAAYFMQDTVAVAMGHLFDNHLVIENNTSHDIQLSLVKKDSFALISLPANIVVKSHQKSSFYVQYLADPGLFENIGDYCQVSYQGAQGRITAGFHLLSNVTSTINLIAYSNTYFMDAKDKELKIQLLCKNMGVQAVQFSLRINSFPQGLLPLNRQSIYQLAPGEQRLVELTIQNSQQRLAVMDYYLDIQAIDHQDPDKPALGLQHIKVVQLGSDKRWDNPGYIDDRLMEHRLEYSYTHSGDHYSYNHLMAEGYTPVIGNNSLQYRFNYNGYFEPVKGNEIYDSYLEWSRPGLDMKVGSVSENMDYGLYGQGLKGTVDWKGPGSLTAMYVERNYLIYSDLYRQIPQEKDIAVQYKWDPAQRRADTAQNMLARLKNGPLLGPFEVHYIYGDDPVTNTLRHLVSGQMELSRSADQYLSLEGGVTREYFQPGAEISRHKDGWAFGAHYGGNWKGVNLSMDNYVSSPYYGGLRRGSVLLSEILSLNLKNGWLTSLQYNRQKNSPSYLSDYYTYLSPRTDRSQIGWAFAKNSKAWSVHFKPYYLEQSLEQQFIGKDVEFDSKGIRGELTVIRRGNKSQFTLTSDAGWVSTDNPYMKDKHYGSWRIMGSYNYGILSINGVLQDGPLYIIEEAAPWQYSGYRNYSFGPSINWTAFRSKLRLQAADYLNYNGFQKQWIHNLSAQGQYLIGTDLAVRADVHINAYSDNLYKDFIQFSFGIQKTFRRRNGPGHHSWQLYFFKDVNANGRWDKGETAFAGVIAQVGDVQVKSAVNGKAVLSDLPEDTYHLQLVDAQTWTLNSDVSINLKRNNKTYIGLIEGIAVNGKIVADSAVLTGKVPNVEGIRVMAKERNTGRVYSTYSNISGIFNFQLPKGEYILTIPTEGTTFSVTEKDLQLAVSGNEKLQVNFHIQDKSRAVDIQEF